MIAPNHQCNLYTCSTWTRHGPGMDRVWNSWNAFHLLSSVLVNILIIYSALYSTYDFDIWFMIFDISFMICQCIHIYICINVYIYICICICIVDIEYDLHAINLSSPKSQFDLPSAFLGQLTKWKRNHHWLKVNFIKFWKSNPIWFWWLPIPGRSCEKWGGKAGQWPVVGCLCFAVDGANVQDVAVEVQDGYGKWSMRIMTFFSLKRMYSIWPGTWWLEGYRFLLGCLVSWQVRTVWHPSKWSMEWKTRRMSTWATIKGHRRRNTLERCHNKVGTWSLAFGSCWHHLLMTEIHRIKPNGSSDLWWMSGWNVFPSSGRIWRFSGEIWGCSTEDASPFQRLSLQFSSCFLPGNSWEKIHKFWCDVSVLCPDLTAPSCFVSSVAKARLQAEMGFWRCGGFAQAPWANLAI